MDLLIHVYINICHPESQQSSYYRYRKCNHEAHSIAHFIHKVLTFIASYLADSKHFEALLYKND